MDTGVGELGEAVVEQARRPRLTRPVKIGIGVVTAAILAMELVLGWPFLADALTHLRTPRWGWTSWAIIAELASMGAFARMQRRLLRAGGTEVQLQRALALAYAAHSLSISLPGGPVYSTAFNFKQMRRFGASPAVASWSVALSGIMSTSALALIAVLAAFLAGGNNLAARVAALISAVAIMMLVRVIAQRPQWLTRPAVFLLGLGNRLLRRSGTTGRERVQKFVDQLSTVHMGTAQTRMVLGWAVLNWVFDAGTFGMCCLAVGAHQISFSTVVIAYSAGMAASNIPIVPGGLGVVDGALVFGLAAGKMPIDDAIASVVVYRIISFVLLSAVGWVLWWRLRAESTDVRQT